MKTLEINEKSRKIKGYKNNTHKITHILLDNCPRVPTLISISSNAKDLVRSEWIVTEEI